MGVNGFRATSKELSFLVDVLDLRDLLLRGSSFTYFGSGQNISRSRFDRFLIFYGAGICFFDICQRVILRVLSNHFPILVFSGDLRFSR